MDDPQCTFGLKQCVDVTMVDYRVEGKYQREPLKYGGWRGAPGNGGYWLLRSKFCSALWSEQSGASPHSQCFVLPSFRNSGCQLGSISISPTAGGTCQQCFTKHREWGDAPECRMISWSPIIRDIESQRKRRDSWGKPDLVWMSVTHRLSGLSLIWNKPTLTFSSL